MTSMEHEFVVDLFRDAPELLPHLLQASLHLELPPFATAAVQESAFTQVVSVEYRADLVVTLCDGNANAVIALVLEVQRQIDHAKRYSWPLYWAALHARMRCRTLLVVLTLDAAVARWAREPIPTLIPAMTPCTVIGPHEIPRIDRSDDAVRWPGLAVLSAQAHGRQKEGVPVVVAALEAIASLDDEHARRYYDWLWSCLDVAARSVMEAVMAERKYEYQSDFAKKYYGEGLSKGLAEGEAKALLLVLAARGVPVSEETRQRVLECSDLALLGRWIERATSATTVEDVLGDS